MQRSTQKTQQEKKTAIQKIGNVFIPIPLIVVLFAGIGALFCAKGHSLDGIINNSYLSGIGVGIVFTFFVYFVYCIVHELRK